MADPIDPPAPGPRWRMTIGHAMALVAASAVASWLVAGAMKPGPILPIRTCNLQPPSRPKMVPAASGGPGGPATVPGPIASPDF